MVLSNYAVCGKKKSALIKNQELHNFSNIWNDQLIMNKIINNFLLTGGKFMLELHLKTARISYNACGPFVKHCETGNLKEAEWKWL